MGEAQLVNRTKFVSSLKNELVPLFNQLSADTRVPKSRLLDEAIEDLLKKYEKRTAKKFIEFCDFVLRNFDHRNFAFVSAKFLLYWAKWSV